MSIMVSLENNWIWTLIALGIIGIIIALILYLTKRKRKNIASLKEEKYQLLQEHCSLLDDLIHLAKEVFNPQKNINSENNEDGLDLINGKYEKSKELLNKNAENYSEKTIRIIKKIHTTVLNSYFLLKKIHTTKTMNMPLENIAPLVDELTYIYSEDIEKGFPQLQKQLTDEIKSIK